ncbi:MAG: nicotinate-nucleotide--dimethylbenzimidazole phosphoribosyltransferase [Lachnospiraceae bacterium]
MYNIEKIDSEVLEASINRWNHIAKPIDGLGLFEGLISQVAAITRNVDAPIEKRAVLVMCADNGVVAEGISQSGQEVTAIVSENIANGVASVNRMSKVAKADVIAVDIGVAAELEGANLWHEKVMNGTRDFAVEPAMSETQMIQAIEVGIACVKRLSDEGYHMVALGEMGIGNTTTSSAIIAALLQMDVEEVTGRGAGLTDEGLLHKITIIEKALKLHGLVDVSKKTQYSKEFAYQTLCCVGGLDICGLVGACIGGAIYHIPIVLDGLISGVSALLAERICPNTKQYLLPSHLGKEPATCAIMKELGYEASITAKLKLGEGTGAVMLFPLLDMAKVVYDENQTFTDIQVDDYKVF